MMFHCNNPDPDFPGCGAEFDRFTVDGYDVGDRMLEGVRFWAWKEGVENPADGTVEECWMVEIHEDDADYFFQFNKNLWYNRIRESVEEMDFAQCPMCKENEFIVNQDVVDNRKVHKLVRTEVSYFSAEELNARDVIKVGKAIPMTDLAAVLLAPLDYDQPIQSGSVVVDSEADPSGVGFMRDMQAMADSRLPIERESDEDEEEAVLWDTLMPPFED